MLVLPEVCYQVANSSAKLDDHFVNDTIPNQGLLL